jgi:large subunit ribosomal protein L9
MAQMKVLLLEDVPNLGLAGDIHTVAGGYARNYLMPRGYVVLATKGALKQADEIRQAAMRQRAQEKANAQAQAEVIGRQKLLFEVRAGENGRLYGSITSADVAERMSEKVGFEVDRRKLHWDQSIRQIGIHEITIRFMADVEATFPVAVVREGETWQDAEARAAAEQAGMVAEETADAEPVSEVETAEDQA